MKLQKFRPIIYAMDSQASSADLEKSIASADAAGFDHIMVEGDGAGLPALLALMPGTHAGLLLRLSLDNLSSGSALRLAHPEWHTARDANDDLPDPRRPGAAPAAPALQLDDPETESAIRLWWIEKLCTLANQGIAGFCLQLDGPASASFFTQVILGVKARSPACRFLAWTPGLPGERLNAISACGFDAAFTSSAWWDFDAPWLAAEALSLQHFPSTIGITFSPGDEARLFLGALTGDGLMVSGDLQGDDAEKEALKAAIDISRQRSTLRRWQALSTAGQMVRMLRFLPAADDSSGGLLLLVNTSPVEHIFHGSTLAVFDGLTLADRIWPPATQRDAEENITLDAHCCALYAIKQSRPVAIPSRDGRRALDTATKAPRIAIERVTPCVDGGRFVAKRSVGDQLVVEADIFGEGHDLLAACVLWRPADDESWHETPMTLLSNDRWQASLPLMRVGRYQFQIEAWIDVFGAWRDEVAKKQAAGQQLELELREGRLLIEAALQKATVEDRQQLKRGLKAVLKALDASKTEAARVCHMLSGELLGFMVQADARAFKVRTTPVLQVDAERRAAGFSSWYELFPRSMGKDVETHGTFSDVIPRLTAIRAMGFDTLYFPPVHPIGLKHRKGKNNSLMAGEDDPGSPYAIGSALGGHDAIHPQLGTLDDFRRLVDAAHTEGLEIALDFAIQCSPDHPWLKDHPDWFSWRPDGSIRYAENPPKKYQDIVNVDFYAVGAVPSLWLALRDVVLFWVNEGIKVFRVDNPHTKPMPFWEWLIGDVRGRHADVIFLAEAFTRPKPMYRLARLGFSQSYSYFTWRHGKDEFIDYLTELSRGEPKDFFRPHFFVNTPDINPYFLQKSGRAGFVIRAALAATLSGLWGMYSGFELCEADPVPGKEEYLNSEKYQLRQRDWAQPGNIVREITLLNRLREENPALQSHLGVRFCKSSGTGILCFTKTVSGVAGKSPNTLFIAICLNPHGAEECDVELPLEDWSLREGASIAAQDLVQGNHFSLYGRHQHLRLDPGNLAFLIWRLNPQGAA